MARATIEQRLKRGDVLRMQIGAKGRIWWFENPYQVVSDERATIALFDFKLIDAGDGLFPMPHSGQSYLMPRGGVH